MIGKKVRVFWPVDNRWYTGIVLQHDEVTGEHLLKYEDQDTEWVKVSENIFVGRGFVGTASVISQYHELISKTINHHRNAQMQCNAIN